MLFIHIISSILKNCLHRQTCLTSAIYSSLLINMIIVFICHEIMIAYAKLIAIIDREQIDRKSIRIKIWSTWHYIYIYMYIHDLKLSYIIKYRTCVYFCMTFGWKCLFWYFVRTPRHVGQILIWMSIRKSHQYIEFILLTQPADILCIKPVWSRRDPRPPRT